MQQDWERRHAFINLSPQQLNMMLTPAFPHHTLSSCELLTAGNCNTNYKIYLSNHDHPFVLRLYIRDRAACQRDQAIYSLVSDRVLTPKLIYADPHFPDYAYAIMSWVDGTLFSDILQSSNPSIIAPCAYDIGKVLAAIGSYTFPHAGFFQPDLSLTTNSTSDHQTSLLSYFNDFLFTGHTGTHLGATLTNQLWHFINEHKHYFSVLDASSSLVHSDFKGFNILVTETHNQWHVSAVLDWEFAFAGSPLFDIGNMLRYAHLHPPIFEHEFIRGFQEHGGLLPPSWRLISQLVDLLSLCEFLNKPQPSPNLVSEITSLITHTIQQH